MTKYRIKEKSCQKNSNLRSRFKEEKTLTKAGVGGAHVLRRHELVEEGGLPDPMVTQDEHPEQWGRGGRGFAALS